MLTTTEQSELHEALYYMKMSELKKACQILSVPDNGKKESKRTRRGMLLSC